MLGTLGRVFVRFGVYFCVRDNNSGVRIVYRNFDNDVCAVRLFLPGDGDLYRKLIDGDRGGGWE